MIYSITNIPKVDFFKNRIKTHFERLNLLNEIRNIFELFCNSIKNSLEKEKAYNFFFSPIDVRKKDSIVNFDLICASFFSKIIFFSIL